MAKKPFGVYGILLRKKSNVFLNVFDFSSIFKYARLDFLNFFFLHAALECWASFNRLVILLISIELLMFSKTF